MTYESFIQQLMLLEVGKQYLYLPSGTSANQNSYKLLSISPDNIRVRRDSDEISISIPQLKQVLQNLVPNKPLDVEKLLGGSGNSRSIIESLICLTPSVFHTRIRNRKHIILIPSKQHQTGELSYLNNDELQSILNEHRLDVENEFRKYLTNIAKSQKTKENLSSTAVYSYLLFIKKDKLFDYDLSSWTNIQDIYDIDSVDELIDIIKKLQTNEKFIERNRSDNAGFRLRAIKQYLNFLLYKNQINNDDEGTNNNNEDHIMIKRPLQRIFYGAPGTGKSHAVKELTKGKNVIRTTFHPDSDYASFVGCYKPTTKQVPVFSTYGEKAVAVKGADGQPVTEDRIVYEFVEQAFLQAYINAWKLYAKAGKDKQPEEQYLIIEEINRGNCAQIFGDLFQLLDRDDAGFSEYPIKTDSDMQKRLEKAFADMAFLNAPALCDMNSEETAIKIRKGEILVLPDNLCIWATMNTSDQSLFPIDSAFKRRWEWQYVPIFDAKENWKIEVDGNLYDWWSFLEEINKRIGATTNSEDKKLGYFFCKAENGIISAEKFVNKVVFYLWNDVFKDFGFDDAIFKDEDGSQLSFNKFYDVENGQTIVRKDKVELFLKNLDLEATEIFKQESDNYEDHASNRNADNIKVEFSDGYLIEEKDATKTFVEVIKRIGAENIVDLNISGVGKYPLLSRERFNDEKGYGDSQRPIGNGYFLLTKMSTPEKVKRLEEISSKLKLNLIITTVPATNK